MFDAGLLPNNEKFVAGQQKANLNKYECNLKTTGKSGENQSLSRLLPEWEKTV
jgi:hypothetical protein